MKKTIIILTIATLFLKAESQQIISASGDFYENANISICWTLGEPVTETVSNGTNILTQGFQQSKLSVSTIKNLNSGTHITACPNPVNEILTLKTEKTENLKYNLTDINGKILKQKNIISENTEISLKNYPKSIYFIKVYDTKKIIKTFKIVKN